MPRWQSCPPFVTWPGAAWHEPCTSRAIVIGTSRRVADTVEQRAMLTLEALGVGVLRTDARGRVDYMNPMLERLTGWPSAEAEGRAVLEVLAVTDGFTGGAPFDAVACALGLRRPIPFPKEALLAQRGGKQFAVEGVATPILDAEHQLSGLVVTVRDVSESRGLERDLTFLATHDLLTGLLNRREFENRLQSSVRWAAAGNAWGLYCVDLDNFGVINDAQGHVVGDVVLKQVAAVLRARLRPGDCVARVGGDEFAVLLEDCDEDDLARFAEELRAELTAIRVAWREGPFQLQASVGAVTLTPDLPDPLRAAQSACRAAAERGGNRVEIYRPDDTAVVRRSGQVAWLHRLNDALENHRFDLVRQRIQPLRLGGSEAPMYEVLLRLPGPSGPPALPAAFLPAAERYRLSQAVDRWVVNRILPAISAESSTTYSLTVNLSAESIGSAKFLALLKADLAASSARADRLCFEITETGVIADLRQAVRFIEEFKSLGCRFLLDDFGRGMSAFAYLRELPVDFLKIDGNIVSRAGEDPVRRAMLESIQQLGRVMRLKTVGECVEDESTLALLAEMGVDFAQGRLVHGPEQFLPAGASADSGAYTLQTSDSP